ncbi:TP6A_N domain-containing protein [Meloidogyne graminicola]|uniref:DNA topoisomerase (ATP-hydrolyzing) n=1 Tax=Meloidogyne graminicola TaxID=189291 RepID=A0A8T0A1R5_9BILA|nr:TP6A_N domain-containing protein [Meloidogyne graminicola]
MVIPNCERRRLELIEMIENAFIYFTTNLCNNDSQSFTKYSMRRSLKRPNQSFEQLNSDPFDEGENGDWGEFEGEESQQSNSSSSIDSSDSLTSIENDLSINSLELLGTTSKRLLNYRLRALAQIHELLIENRHATKRDLFYESKKIYEQQSNFDRALTAICNFLMASRSELNVLSCSKGFVMGSLKLLNALDDNEIDFRFGTIALNESLINFDFAESEAKAILILEKDSVFQCLLDEKFLELFPNTILITGRGYPDICTRRFLAYLSSQLPNISMFILTDADPYGVEIFLTYKYGSDRTWIESGGVTLPNLKWIGLLPSDANNLPIPGNQLLSLTNSDKRRINKLSNKVLSIGENNVFDELSIMLSNNYKLEIEALYTLGNKFLSTVYLKYKMEEQNDDFMNF